MSYITYTYIYTHTYIYIPQHFAAHKVVICLCKPAAKPLKSPKCTSLNPRPKTLTAINLKPQSTLNTQKTLNPYTALGEAFEPGILARVNRGILYIDEVPFRVLWDSRIGFPFRVL